MVISDIVLKSFGEYQELSANVCPEVSPEVNFRVWFKLPSEIGNLPLLGDGFVAGFLIPCMYRNENLYIDAPVSSRLLSCVETIQSIINSWSHCQLKKITVSCAQTYENNLKKGENTNVACFFSGGVDSWYSVLKHKETISSLVLIKGFDIKTENEQLWESTKQSLADAAQALGKRAITVETNLREYADMRRCSWTEQFQGDFWGKFLFGSALATVGLSMQATFDRIIIPASFSYAQLSPWGSHPLLDPLWSTENTAFIHDGCEATRMDKTKTISESKAALSRLRVCYCNRPGRYNCCICEKCCRTMLALEVCGSLENASSFDMPLDLNLVKKRQLPKHVMVLYRDILEEAEKTGNRELISVVKIGLGEEFSLYRVSRIAWDLTKRFLRRFRLLRRLVKFAKSRVKNSYQN